MPPESHRFMADIDAPLMEQIFHISEGKRKPYVQHHGQADDLTARFEIAEWVRFGHEGKLRNRPASLKLVCSDSALAADLCDIRAPLQLRRRGIEAKLVIGDVQPTPDPALTKALNAAHHWAKSLRDGAPLKVIADAADCTGAHIRKRGQLAFLSPKIQIAIRDGTLSQDITLEHILRQKIPLDWTHQERMFGV